MDLESRQTLLKFEKSLRPRFREVGLIGEIPLSDNDALKIQQALRDLIASAGPEYATQFLHDHAPHSLACFLVWKGVQGYREGDYWSEVCRPIGLSTHWQQKWGQIFEAGIRRSQLADFRDVAGHRFVTPILLHGGIPASCLPDFFDKVIGPAVQDSLGYSDNAPDLIDDFLDSSRVQTTNKPVRRFLEKGGKIAADFVQRCVDLALQADSGEPASSGEEFGLPPYVIDQFSTWWEESAASQSQTSRRTDLPRYRAPQTFLSIDQGGLYFSFPAQRIPRNALSDTRELRLEVQQDGECIEYPLYGTRTGEMIETEIHDAALKLGEKYEFTLFAGTTPLRTWSFSGLSSKQPWLIFHGPSEKLLPGWVITERDIWIVFPTSWTIDPTPSVRVLEEAAFTREFQAKRLLVEGHPPDIWFTDGDGKSVSVPVKWRDTPTLQPASTVTWPRLSSEDSSGEFMVYCGSPPRLLIPRPVTDRALLTITPTRQSYPAGRKKIRLKDIHKVSLQDDYLTLALEDPDLLGPTPCGRFVIRVRGRLGHDTAFRLCLLPEMKFDFPRSSLLPDQQTGPQIVSFFLAHPHLGELSVKPPGEQSYDGDSYCVEVPADSDHVDVTLHMTTGEEPAKVPIEIPVSRLRWAVSGLDEGYALHWQDTPIAITLQDLEEAHDSQEVRLLVRGDFGQDTACSFSLEGTGQSQPLSLKNGSGECHLSPFLDSLRSSGRSRNELHLEFSLPDEDSLRRMCLVRVNTIWLVEDLQIIQDFTPTEDKRTVLFGWRERGNVKNRALRLWSLDRQLEKPIEIPVEDSRSEVEFHSSLADFPHGLYRLELTILDEWAGPSSPALPSPDAGSVFDLDVRKDEIERLDSSARRLEVLAPRLRQITERRLEILNILFNRLTDTDADIRQQAVRALEALGVDAIARTVEQLTDTDESVRHHAARALGLLANPRAVLPLIQRLTDTDESVRNQAVHALVEIGPPAVDPLMDSLTHDDEAVRQQADRTLVKLGMDSTDRLIVDLTDPDEEVRYRAVYALGQLADPRAVEPLRKIQRTDNNMFIRLTAGQALTRLETNLAAEERSMRNDP